MTRGDRTRGWANDERGAWEAETRRNAYVSDPAAGPGRSRTKLTDQRLPVYEGVIHVELGAEPVPYRIIATADGVLEEKEYHDLAVSTCRVACLSADVIRGKLASAALKRAVSASCIKRLETLAYLIDYRMRRDVELRAKMRYLPVIPHDVSGTLVSETSLEMVVKLSVGGIVYWSTIKLRRIGCRWMCVVVDMG